MAEWTGYQYGFYTNKPIDFVLSEWRKKVLAINYKYDYSIDEGDKFLFCNKNNEMYEYHLENGYNIDMQGEGCFMIEEKKSAIERKGYFI